MENIDGGLHPAVDGQSLDEDEDESIHSLLESAASIGDAPWPLQTFQTAESDSTSALFQLLAQTLSFL